MAQIQFKGKSFVQNHHPLVKYHELIPKKDKSLTDKVSLHDNLIIHGDNLIAFKALLPLYAGKIKCIYIMIRLCRETGLPEPDFEQRGTQFVVTIWRDWLTEEVIVSLGLNDRQRKAINCIRRKRRLTNAEYQEITGASRATAKRDLEDLVRKGVLVPMGAGRGAFYNMPKKRLINGSNGSSVSRKENGS
jgi:hypothetical protein